MQPAYPHRGAATLPRELAGAPIRRRQLAWSHVLCPPPQLQALALVLVQVRALALALVLVLA